MKKLFIIAAIATNVFAMQESQLVIPATTPKQQIVLNTQTILVKNDNKKLDWTKITGKVEYSPNFIFNKTESNIDFAKLGYQFNILSDADLLISHNNDLSMIGKSLEIRYVKSVTNGVINSGVVTPGYSIAFQAMPIDSNKILLKGKINVVELKQMSKFNSGSAVIDQPNTRSCDLQPTQTVKLGETLVIDNCKINYDNVLSTYFGESKVADPDGSRDANIIFLITPRIVTK
ncbi:MAG: hypothetical protein EKK54_06115 [Neisseriaceae bacterium]|nr:MAG: hypothetical protein EKK54_06115 [Neisseriaceae bacterium]